MAIGIGNKRSNDNSLLMEVPTVEKILPENVFKSPESQCIEAWVYFSLELLLWMLKSLSALFLPAFYHYVSPNPQYFRFSLRFHDLSPPLTLFKFLDLVEDKI